MNGHKCDQINENSLFKLSYRKHFYYTKKKNQPVENQYNYLQTIKLACIFQKNNQKIHNIDFKR